MKKPFIKSENEALGRPDLATFKQLSKQPIVVVLDAVRSAHNVGSVFRTADAFLIEELLLCGITPTPPNKEIRKTALGAEQSVNWRHMPTTKEAIEQLKLSGYQVWAVEQASGSVELSDLQLDPNQKYALVFGNEVYGVDDTIMPLCDGVVEIAQKGTKHSLNVSVSAGIVLWKVSELLQNN